MDDVELAVLREIYSYWEKGDFRPTHFLQPDFELVFGSDFLDRGSYKGLEEVSAGWRAWLSPWTSWAASAREYVPVGDRILVLIDVEGVAKSSGVEMGQPSANLWEFRAGLASRLTLYTRAETALREAGIAE